MDSARTHLSDEADWVIDRWACRMELRWTVSLRFIEYPPATSNNRPLPRRQSQAAVVGKTNAVAKTLQWSAPTQRT